MSQLLANAWTSFCDIQESELSQPSVLFYSSADGDLTSLVHLETETENITKTESVFEVKQMQTHTHQKKKKGFSPYTLNQRGFWSLLIPDSDTGLTALSKVVNELN